MTTTQISVATAPRDIAGLKNLGRFNMRILAQELGAFEQEETKTAFMQQSTDEQVAFVHKLLLEKDGGGKASKGAGGASPRQPSTKGAAKGGGVVGKPAGEAAKGTGGGGTATAGPAVGAGAEKLLAAIGELNEKIDGFNETLGNLQTAVEQLQGISAGTNRFVALAIGLSGKLAEQVMGASLAQIIDVVLEDMPAVEEAMKRMAPAAEEDEEPEAGNEE